MTSLSLISSPVACFLAWIFVVAGWHKFRHGDFYQGIFAEYLPWLSSYPSALKVVRFMVATAEILLAIGLLIPALVKSSLLLASAMLAFYALAMAWQIARKNSDLNCGCSGPAATTTISSLLVIRNVVLVAIALLAYYLTSVALLSTVSALLTGLLVSVFLIMSYYLCEQLISNRQKLALLR